jgi:hypothetical protein
MDEILGSHLIEPAPLWADDFDRFFQARSLARQSESACSDAARG